MPIGRSRSSKVVDFGTNRKGVCDFLLVINSTLVLSCTVSEIWRVIGWKFRIFPTPPLFDAPIQGNPFDFLDETHRAKTRGMGLLYGENCTILTTTVFAWITRVTDGQMDGRNCDSICALSIYAVARKNINSLRLIAYPNWLQLCGIARFIASDSMWVAYSKWRK